MKNFIVVGTQRTGSSVISETIGLHPEVTCGWEWTLGVARRKKIKLAGHGLASNFKFLDDADQAHMAEVHHENKVWLGFRWLFSSSCKWIFHPRFSPALWVDCLEDFIEWVSQRPEIHIIHVVRENSLDWLKSIYMARKTKLYSKEKYPEGFSVKIPKWEAVYRVKSKTWVDKRLYSLRRTNPFIIIKYEAFIQNQNKVASLCFKFLNCDSKYINPTAMNLKKQSVKNASAYVKNYQNIEKLLYERNLLKTELNQAVIAGVGRSKDSKKFQP